MREWTTVSLDTISSQRKGISYKSEDYSNSEDGHPFITIKCVVKGGGYEPTGIKFYNGLSIKADHLAPGDLLFAVTDLTRAGDIVGSPLRVPNFGSSKPALASMDCMRIEPDASQCDKRFLYHLLMLADVRGKMVAYSAGSTVLHLDTKRVPGFLVRIPKDIRVQAKIATVLDGIDTSIEKTEALIAKHQQIKAGLMHDLFTRGVLPNGQLRPPRSEAPALYRETAMGWIPLEWSVSDCVREFAIDAGITLGPHRRPGKNAHAYLRVANVHRDELRLEDIAYLEEFSGDADLPLKKKDLLVVEGHANRMEIGRCAMVSEAAVGMLFQNHLFRLRPQRLMSEFALAWLNSHHAQRYWDTTCSTSSGLNTINRKMLIRLPVLVPTDGEQTQIVNAISVAKRRIEGLSLQAHKLQNQKHGLMQDLLTGRVSVKLEEPDKEPA